MIPTDEEILAQLKKSEVAAPVKGNSYLPKDDEILKHLKGSSVTVSPSSDGVESHPIPKSDHPKATGWLEKTLEGLDYLGNASRSAIKGASEGGLDKFLEYGGEALQKKRYTDPSELRKKFLFDSVGKDDGEFQAGDLVDFAGDVAVDVATDPLNLMTAGLGRVAKTGTTLGKAMQAAKLGEVNKFTKAKAVAAPALGAVYGAGMSDPDASVGDVAKNAAIGAGVVLGAKEAAIPLLKRGVYGGKAESKSLDKFFELTGKVSPSLTRKLQEGEGFFDFASNTYNRSFGPKEIQDVTRKIETPLTPSDEAKLLRDQGADRSALPKTKVQEVTTKELQPIAKNLAKEDRIAREAFERRQRIAVNFAQKNYEALEGLSDPEVFEVMNHLANLKDYNVKLRENIFNDLKKKRMLTEKDVGSPLYSETWDQATREANARMSGVTMHKLQQLEREGNTRIAHGVRNWHDKMYDVKSMINKQMRDLGAPKEMEGLFTYLPEVRAKTLGEEMLDEAGRDAPDFIHHRRARESWEHKSPPLGFDPALSKEENVKQFRNAIKVYAERESYKMLSKIEREALDNISKTNDAKGAFLRIYDGVTSYVKTTLLHGSLAWLKNNYFDNLYKSYMENGVFVAVKSSTWSQIADKNSRDILNILKGEVNYKFKDDFILRAYNSGVLDGPAMKALGDDYTKEFLSSPLRKVREAERASDPLMKLTDKTKKAGDAYKAFMRRTTGQLGSYQESIMRLTTLKNQYEMLKNSPYVKELAQKEGAEFADAKAFEAAAKITQDAFFNYGDLTHFENAVIKRFIPFYSFYCVDEETLCFTKRGWLRYDELTTADELYTFNADEDKTEWLNPESVNIFQYDQSLPMYSFKKKEMDAFVTPNHKWMVRNTYKDKWEMRESHEAIYNYPLPTVLGEAEWLADPLLQDDYVRLLAWVATEGSYRKPKGDAPRNEVVIYQSPVKNPQKCAEIERVLASLGIDYTVSTSGPNRDVNSYYLKGDVRLRLREDMPLKHATPELIQRMTKDQIRIFIETALDGDGSRVETETGVYNPLTTNRWKEVEAYLMMCTIIGVKATVNTKNHRGEFNQNHPCYVINFVFRGKNGPAVTGVTLGKPRVVEGYAGKVWCPSTRNGTFLAMRNGRVYWTGNSKNLPYWTKNFFDIEKAGRVANVDKLRKNIGETVTEDEKKGLNAFLGNSAPRRIGGKGGDMNYVTIPSFSMHDAIKTLNPSSEISSEVWDRLSPILKTAIEIGSNRDYFMDGQDLRPSKLKGGEKYLFSRGHAYKFIQDMIDHTLGTDKVFGVDVNKKGNVKTTSDILPKVDKVLQISLPYGGTISKALGTYGKNLQGKETPTESVNNLLGPVQTTKVFPEVYWQNRRRKEGEKAKELADQRKKQQEEEIKKFVERLRK